jgi:predicted phage tail protein
MWCSACHQDVPGVAASVDDVTMCCARCGKALGHRPAPAEEPATPVVVQSEADDTNLLDLSELEETPDFVEVDEWDFEEALSNAERLVRTVQAQDRAVDILWSSRPTGTAGPHRRVDNSPRVNIETATDTAGRQQSAEATSVPLFVLALGLAIFVCGAALAGWSLMGHGEHLWRLGMPMVMGGQVAMLAGLMWQLEAVWQSNRDTKNSVETLDEQVRLMRRRVASDSSHSHDGRAFYRHLAENASPHILLADLKGQLDTLSQRLASQRANRD